MHRKQGFREDRFGERFGQASLPRAQGRWIWVHAASLGEVGQTAKLIEMLHDQTGAQILVTTVTQSGADWVAKTLPSVVHQYLPLDTPKAVGNFLDHWSPEMALFVESDIWPGLVQRAKMLNIPLVLLNARPSKSRKRAPKSYRYLLSLFFAITCKSPQVLEEIAALGIARERLFYFGDLRASVPPLPVDQVALSEVQSALSDRPVWVAASSHADDEAEIITACHHVLAHQPDTLLIWVPRHPNRADKIIEAAQGLQVHQRTKGEPITPDVQIYLADTFGEMGTFLACSRTVFLGGSFGHEGGHNPFEPACFGCYMITGPNIQNHHEAFSDLIEVGAAVIVANGSQLGETVVRASTTQSAASGGERGRALITAADMSASQTAGLLVKRLASQ